MLESSSGKMSLSKHRKAFAKKGQQCKAPNERLKEKMEAEKNEKRAKQYPMKESLKDLFND